MKRLMVLLFLLLNMSLVLCQETAEELNKKGLELYNSGKYEESIKYFDKALKIDSDVYQIWNNKGLSYYKLKKYEEAVKCFDKSVLLSPGYVNGWYNKGCALLMMKNYDKAIVCFDKVLQLDQKHSGAKSKKEQAQSAINSQNSVKDFINKGLELYNQGKYDEAIKYYDKAITLDPANETAYVKKGHSLAKEGKYDEAIKCYDKVLAGNPKHIEGLYGKGDALFAQGKYKEALECYNKILAIKPDENNAKNKKDDAEKALADGKNQSADQLFQQGEVFFNEKNIEEALKYYNKALAVDPEHVKSLFKKGGTLIVTEFQKGNGFDMDKLKEGYDCIDKITKLLPECVEAWDLKGDVLAKTGLYDKALDCYKRVFELKPDFKDIHFKIQEMEKALAGQVKVPENSDRCKDLYDKGSILYKEGKFNEALGMFQQALDINQQYVPALFKKGLTLAMLSYGKDKKKIKESTECFLSIYSLDPELKQCDINGKDNMGTTPLQISLMRKALVLTHLPELLIDKGADVNTKNNDGNTALHETARFGYLEITRKLLDKGADVTVKNNDGFTPLHSASASGFVKVAELLIEKGANVNAKSNDGRTPLQVAGGNSEMKELLRAKGAKE